MARRSDWACIPLLLEGLYSAEGRLAQKKGRLVVGRFGVRFSASARQTICLRPDRTGTSLERSQKRAGCYRLHHWDLGIAPPSPYSLPVPEPRSARWLHEHSLAPRADRGHSPSRLVCRRCQVRFPGEIRDLNPGVDASRRQRNSQASTMCEQRLHKHSGEAKASPPAPACSYRYLLLFNGEDRALQLIERLQLDDKEFRTNSLIVP